mgnify:FL=1
MLKRLLLIFLFLIPSHLVMASITPIIVVTPSGYEMPLNRIGSSVTVITASDIEASGYTTVSEILNTVPGINAVTNGFGGTVGLFSRGHDSDMTKIMLDGIDLNDPSALGTTPVLATLMLNNIEQIEIVLGPQSLIAGADAMGGVINIITKKGIFNNEAGAYAGSDGTSNLSSSLAFAYNDLNINLNLNEFETDGINVRSAGNDDLDGFDQSSISLNLSRNFEKLLFNLSYKNEAGRVEFDESVSQSKKIYADNDYTFFRAGLSFDLNPKSNIRVEYNNSDFDRKSYGRWADASYYSEVEGFKLNSKYLVNSNNTAFFGLETKSEKYTGTYGPSNNDGVSEISYFAQNEFKIGQLTTLLAGIRLDDNDEFGTHETYRFTANRVSQNLSGIIFKFSIGTGFRAPSLSEMYDGTYGNTNLDPETSFGYDFGFVNYISSNVSMGSTYFMSEIEDSISWAVSGYYNASGKSERDGIETFVNIYPNDKSEIKLSHTHLMTDEKVLVRRPNNTLTASINYKLNNKIDIYGSLNAVEKHYDTSSAVIESYEIINLGMRYDLNSNSLLNFRINNLTDETYEQVSGYPGLPRQVFIGLDYQF